MARPQRGGMPSNQRQNVLPPSAPVAQAGAFLCAAPHDGGEFGDVQPSRAHSLIFRIPARDVPMSGVTVKLIEDLRHGQRRVFLRRGGLGMLLDDRLFPLREQYPPRDAPSD